MYFVVGSGVAVVCSAGLWLAFFLKLGPALGDSELEAAAWSYVIRLGCCVLLLGALAGAAFDLNPRNRVLAWTGEAAFMGVLLWLLRGYTGLLNTAVRAVERRVPSYP